MLLSSACLNDDNRFLVSSYTSFLSELPSVRHIILISGKDSLATALVQLGRAPDLPYELVNNEVGWDLPETLEWIGRVGEHFGREIIKCGDDLTEICIEQNCLPTTWRRFCTKYAKIKPLNDFIGTAEATIYFGLRADEPDRMGYVVPPRQRVTCSYPLRDVGMGLVEVWRLCQSVNLLPPQFRWEWMENRVRELLDGDDFLLDRLSEWERAALLAWRSRSNCDRCFYARLYEKIGLLEHYPDRFWDAVALEERLCHKAQLNWVLSYRLRDLVPRAEEIKEKRAKAIVRYLRTLQQTSLFEDDPMDDHLQVTSCGLLCGK